MRVVVIGGSGHVGTYLVPMLVQAGHEVLNISRGKQKPYRGGPEWQQVEMHTIDRQAYDEAGRFGHRIAELRPDVVIDLICFTPDSCEQLATALQGRVQHFLHCGTIWVHGHSEVVPVHEDAPRRPIDSYGRRKAAIESYLLDEARCGRLPATVLHAGHIVGPGWRIINPQGNTDVEVWGKLARGEALKLPHFGMETLHHVHAEDVAQGFYKAMTHWSDSVGEAMHIVSPGAVTLRGYAWAAAGWFGQQAHLKFLPWDQFREGLARTDADMTHTHVVHSPNASIDKARRLIDYQPRYTSLAACREAVDWLVEHDQIEMTARA